MRNPWGIFGFAHLHGTPATEALSQPGYSPSAGIKLYRQGRETEQSGGTEQDDTDKQQAQEGDDEQDTRQDDPHDPLTMLTTGTSWLRNFNRRRRVLHSVPHS